jgi:hypothetical protein
MFCASINILKVARLIPNTVKRIPSVNRTPFEISLRAASADRLVLSVSPFPEIFFRIFTLERALLLSLLASVAGALLIGAVFRT